MKVLEKISENEIVAEFLKAEINSSRWGEKLEPLLIQGEIKKSVLDNPDLKNELENKQREWVLANFRGWKQNKDLFENFPEDIEWYRAILQIDDLKKIKYMNYSYWNELSNHTGLVTEGIKTIKAGIKIYGKSNDGFKKAAQYVKEGGKFPKLILVAKDKNSQLILLEGHLRATAMLWQEETITDKLEVFVGFSDKIEHWNKD